MLAPWTSVKRNSEATLSTNQDRPLQIAPSNEPDVAVVLAGRGSLYTRQPSKELYGLARRLLSAGSQWLIEIALFSVRVWKHARCTRIFIETTLLLFESRTVIIQAVNHNCTFKNLKM